MYNKLQQKIHNYIFEKLIFSYKENTNCFFAHYFTAHRHDPNDALNEGLRANSNNIRAIACNCMAVAQAQGNTCLSHLPAHALDTTAAIACDGMPVAPLLRHKATRVCRIFLPWQCFISRQLFCKLWILKAVCDSLLKMREDKGQMENYLLQNTRRA